MKRTTLLVIALALLAYGLGLGVAAQEKPAQKPAAITTVSSSAPTMQLSAPNLSEVALLRVMLFASEEDKLTAQFRQMLTERAQFTAIVEQQIVGYTMDWTPRPPKLVKLPEKPAEVKPEKK